MSVGNTEAASVALGDWVLAMWLLEYDGAMLDESTVVVLDSTEADWEVLSVMLLFGKLSAILLERVVTVVDGSTTLLVDVSVTFLISFEPKHSKSPS